MMVSTPDSGNSTPEQSGGDGEHNGDVNGDDIMDIDDPECTVQKIDTKSHAAQIILITRDGHLTQANADRIVQDAKIMVQSTIDSLKVQLI